MKNLVKIGVRIIHGRVLYTGKYGTRKVYREERIRDQSSIEEYKGAEGGRG